MYNPNTRSQSDKRKGNSERRMKVGGGGIKKCMQLASIEKGRSGILAHLFLSSESEVMELTKKKKEKVK